MAEIKTFNGREVIDYTARDYAGIRQALLNRIAEKLPNWTDRSEADFGIVLIELFAYMADILSYYQDRIANESFLTTAQERYSAIQHLRLIGYELAPAAPASADLKLTFEVPATRTGKIQIRRGDQFSSKSASGPPASPAVVFEYANQTPLEIDLDDLITESGKKKFESGKPLKSGKIAPFVPVQEGRLTEKELLGQSDGKANQRYLLARPYLIRGSLDLFVTESGVPDKWNWREALAYSLADDKGYILQTDENDLTAVIFGDGENGKIPASGAEIRATYRTGGGRSGNVPAKSITTILKSADLVPLGATVINESAATGGEERESIEHAIRFAPLVFKSNRRAVTAEDYMALAKQFPGVGKARTFAVNANRIHLAIAPTSGGYVTDVMCKDLLAYFEDKRMLTTQIHIINPDYVPIFITARVTAKRFVLQAEVKNEVQRAVQNLLDFDKVDFKAIIFLSDVYKAIEDVTGVENVIISQFRSGSPAQVTDETDPNYDANTAIAKGGRLSLSENEIPVPGYPYPEFLELRLSGGVEDLRK